MMTHCLRPILLGGVLLMASACAKEDFSTWSSHPTHYASDRHMGFSARNVGATRVRVTPEDVAAAQREKWWGRGIAGLLAGGPPAAVAGQWRGDWLGKGISTARGGPVQAEFVVNPDGYGRGRIALTDTAAVEGIPWTLRQAGSMGVPVWVKVDGNAVMLAEAQDPGSFHSRFTAEFAAEGDRMTGSFRHLPRPINITLLRQR